MYESRDIVLASLHSVQFTVLIRSYSIFLYFMFFCYVVFSLTLIHGIRVLDYVLLDVSPREWSDIVYRRVEDVMRRSKEQNQAGSLHSPEAWSGLRVGFSIVLFYLALVHFAGVQCCSMSQEPTDQPTDRLLRLACRFVERFVLFFFFIVFLILLSFLTFIDTSFNPLRVSYL